MLQCQGCHANAGILNRHIVIVILTLRRFPTARWTKRQIIVEIRTVNLQFGATQQQKMYAGIIVLSQCVRVSRRMWTLNCRVNTLRPTQNGRYFPDDTFNCICFNENIWISIKIWLTFVPEAPINNIPALVQMMAWHSSGDKPLSESMMA